MLLVYLAMIDDEKNKDVFEQIYVKYRKLMYSTAFKVLQNHHLAEEAIQDVFLNLFKKLKG